MNIGDSGVGENRKPSLIDTFSVPLYLRISVLSLLILILLVGAAVRFHNIEVQSLWNDEGISYQMSLRTLPEISERAARDIHPPLYYWMLAAWRVLTGETEFALRSFSAFFSILSVALTFALGKRLYGNLAGLAAAAFVALNTFSIYYAQEVRMYSLLTAISAVSMWVYIEVVFSPSPRREKGLGGEVNSAQLKYLALALLNVAGLYTHYSYPLVMLAQGIMFVAWIGASAWENYNTSGLRTAVQRELPLLARYVVANVITIVLFLPLLGQGYLQVASQPNISEAIPIDLMLRNLQGWLAFGNTFEYSIGGMGVAMYFFLIFGLLRLPEQQRRGDSWWRMLLPVVWVLLSVGIFLALELYLRYMRFLLPVQVGFAVWMGRGVWVLWTVKTRERTAPIKYLPKFAALFGTFGLLVNMFGGLNPLYSNALFQRDDYRGMAQTIATNYRDGDVVILNAPNQAEVFSYYYHGQAPVVSMPTSNDDAQTLTEINEIISDYERVYALFWGTAERDPNNIVQGTLNQQAFQASDVWYGDVRFVRYAMPAEFTDLRDSGAQFGDSITLERYALSSETLQAGDVLQVHLEWLTSEILDTRYKVFIQLLNPDGTLAAQRDSEPGGGQALTTTWTPDETITDNHALIIPDNLPAANYTLILGLYDLENPDARLSVNGESFLNLGTIQLDSN